MGSADDRRHPRSSGRFEAKKIRLLIRLDPLNHSHLMMELGDLSVSGALISLEIQSEVASFGLRKHRSGQLEKP